MERTVPRTGSEEVELYLRTYYSLLRSTDEVRVRTLEEVHAGMKSLLHPLAREPQLDLSAFIYCLLRLPECIPQVQLVVLGQSYETFRRHGFGDVEGWKSVFGVARRRRSLFDGQGTLACYIASRSDIDDIIPQLTAFQIEWNKMHRLLQEIPEEELDAGKLQRGSRPWQELSRVLQIGEDGLTHLHTVLGSKFVEYLRQMRSVPKNFSVRLLSGSLSEYRRATQYWWDHIVRACKKLESRPIYFVSSNTHSLMNLLYGFAWRHKDRLLEFLEEAAGDQLKQEWQDIQTQRVPSSQENFFYYVLKKYLDTPQGEEMEKHRLEHEGECGIMRLPVRHSFDVEAQVVEISRLCPENFDPRLRQEDGSFLAESDALILNIDYPLGMAAYHILSLLSEQVGEVLGVYIMGKAATLNGVVGDVVIPNVVHDEHSQNTYLFPNCFTAASLTPFLEYGSVMDNQKAVSVRGTMLQNYWYMDVFYREGYTDIEMEAGPYLSAVYEMYRPKRHPVNEIVNLYGLPFDLGILHYASDTPLSKGRNLGAGSLSYFGMDATYATSIAILRRIFQRERERICG
ncbi:MAG: hypothetical protein AB1345_09435 [Chloroflexota bacterium]